MSKFVSPEPDLTFDDVLINPERSDVISRFDDGECLPYVKHADDYYLPIVSSPMDSVPSEEFIVAAESRLMTIFTCRFLPFEEQLRQIALAPGRVGGVIGVKSTSEEIRAICDAGATDILLDVANGGNESIVRALRNVELQSRRSSGFRVWAGNVANAEGYRMLAEHCDFVRVGIGNGSACTTRINTGVGRGTITSLLECRAVYENIKSMSHGRKVAKLVADGGLKYNGDFGKAFVAGAHAVMTGRIFAGTYESAAPSYIEGHFGPRLDVEYTHCPNVDFSHDGILRDDLSGAPITHKGYRGMASKAVNEEAGREMARVSVEGASGMIPVTGQVNTVLDEIEANLRSTISYAGAGTVSELYEKGRFALVSPSVTIENRAHGFN